MSTEIKTYAPVLIPTLNRYGHLKRCVESLATNDLAAKTELIIGLDYPPSEKYIGGYNKVKDFLPLIKGFKKVTILTSEVNLNPDGNINRLFEYVRKEGYESFIVTEDDNEFSHNFLEYINWGLERFKEDDSVFAICGFKNIETSDIVNNVYKLNTIFSAWGYGTWCTKFDKLMEWYDKAKLTAIIHEASVFKSFTLDVCKLSSLTYQVAMNSFHGDMLVSLLPEDERWCIFPKVNKVRNWGWDGTGLHGGSPKALKKYSTMPIDLEERFEPIIVEDLYNPVIYERFKKRYKASKKAYIRAAITFLCYKLTGYIPVSNLKSKWLKVKLLKVQ